MSVTYVTAHFPTIPLLDLRQSSFSNLSVTSRTSPLILQPFRPFTYVTAHFTTLPLFDLRHSSFSNPSFASHRSQALQLRHVASRPWYSTMFTKTLVKIWNGEKFAFRSSMIDGPRKRLRTHYPSREESFPVRFQIEGSVSYPCIFQTSLCHLNKVRLRYRVPALKERMTDDHRLFHLAFAEENVN